MLLEVSLNVRRAGRPASGSHPIVRPSAEAAAPSAQREWSETYGQIAAALAVAASVTDVASAVVVQVLGAIGATQGVLAIPDRERSYLTLTGTRTSSTEDGGSTDLIQADVARVRVEEAFPIARAFNENAPIFVEDTDVMSNAVARAISVPGARALACIPLRERDECLGVLRFGFPERRAFSDEDRNFLHCVARITTLALQRARAFEREQEARKAAEALAESAAAARAEAENASRMKDEFLSVASHELRTPVTTMQLLVQSVMRQSERGVLERDELIGRLHKVDAQSRRLVALVDSLLDVSRISAGRLSLACEELDLVDLVRTVATRFEDEAASAGTPIEIEAPEQLVGTWDPVRLDQIVTNLLSNAIKYGRHKPIAICVEPTRRGARIVVTDRGIGVAPENLERIFERFERLESVRNYGGFGIGLWIVRELLRAMDGSIRVESKVGAGSTFTVELPR